MAGESREYGFKTWCQASETYARHGVRRTTVVFRRRKVERSFSVCLSHFLVALSLSPNLQFSSCFRQISSHCSIFRRSLFVTCMRCGSGSAGVFDFLCSFSQFSSPRLLAFHCLFLSKHPFPLSVHHMNHSCQSVTSTSAMVLQAIRLDQTPSLLTHFVEHLSLYLSLKYAIICI